MFSSFVLFAALLCIVNVAQAQNAAPATRVDLSPEFARWKLSMKSQLRRDTCAVFTVTGALEYGLSKNLDYGVRLSDEYLNWAANEANGDWGDGALFTELQRGFTKWGIAEEADMPYNRAFSTAYVPEEGALASARQVWEMRPKWNWIVRDSANGLTNAHIATIKRVLRSDWKRRCASA
jgi:hypothetical protein